MFNFTFIICNEISMVCACVYLKGYKEIHHKVNSVIFSLYNYRSFFSLFLYPFLSFNVFYIDTAFLIKAK